MVERPHHRAHGSGPWLGCPVYERLDSRVHHRPGTHETGFHRDIHRCPSEAIVVYRLGRVTQGDDLGMGRGVDSSNRMVVSGPNHLPVEHDDGTNRNLAGIECVQSLTMGEAHPRMVFRRVDGDHRPILPDRAEEVCGRGTRTGKDFLLHGLLVDPDADLTFLFCHPDNVTT